MLTPKREAFATGLAQGFSQRAAYRSAFPRSEKWKDGTVDSHASRLAKDDKVQARLADLQLKAGAANEVTLTNHVATLADLRDEARHAGQMSAAVAAEVARGKASGLYIEKHELTGKGGGPVQSISISAEEFRAIALDITSRI